MLCCVTHRYCNCLAQIYSCTLSLLIKRTIISVNDQTVVLVNDMDLVWGPTAELSVLLWVKYCYAFAGESLWFSQLAACAKHSACVSDENTAPVSWHTPSHFSCTDSSRLLISCHYMSKEGQNPRRCLCPRSHLACQ